MIQVLFFNIKFSKQILKCFSIYIVITDDIMFRNMKILILWMARSGTEATKVLIKQGNKEWYYRNGSISSTKC